ncbi:bone morphogenetic protein 5 [Aplysia californica]|uniref:Bone morphogenetic protein 5 n=1 Tax=Aplysia californica TaxID=6500 RepID=A0ABM1A160_APLCA|nr:bone morphogenetic protein 5 [Aplysia californica]
MSCVLYLCAFVACTYGVYGYSSSFYTDNDLGQSVPMGKVKNRQRDEVQQELLELMGLYSKPKSKSNEKIIQSASKFMRDLYESLRELDQADQDGGDDSHIHISSSVNASALGLDPAKVEGSDVIVSFVNHARKMAHLRHERDRTFFFDFSEVSVGEQVKGAELRIYKEASSKFASSSFTISLYRIKQGQDWEDKILELESNLRVSGEQTGWVTLDATDVAEYWTFFPLSNMGLYLKVTDENGEEFEPKEIGLVGRRGPADKQPFLVGYMDMSPEVLSRRARSIRSKRWADPQDRSYSDNPYAEYSRTGFTRYRAHNNCQRHNLYINFRDIGFDSEFLIAPEGYSLTNTHTQKQTHTHTHTKTNTHTQKQTHTHTQAPLLPKPCCAPTKFGTITLLYYDDNSSVVLKRFREMIVKACGCH